MVVSGKGRASFLQVFSPREAVHAPVDLPKATQRLTALSRLNGFLIKRTYKVEGGQWQGGKGKVKCKETGGWT